MQIDMEEFEKGFDIGLSQAGSMGKRAARSTIIELCKNPNKPSKNKPCTLGQAAFVPILDKGFAPIHKVEGVEEVTVPVVNPDWNEADPDSPQFFYRTYRAIPDYAYLCPLTDSERERIKGLYDLIKDYNESFDKYGNSIKTLFFMKVFMIKLQSTVSGTLYDDLKEPVIIQHNSTEFPKAYSTMCNTNDSWGKGWRKDLYLPDGDIVNVAICTTEKKDVGYKVTFEYKAGVQTGKQIPRANLEQWMDFDINTIGIDCTCVDMNRIQEAVDAINAEWDRQQGVANTQLSGNVAQQAQPQANVDALGAQLSPQDMGQAQNIPQQAMAQPQMQTQASQQAMQAQPSFNNMNPVGQPVQQVQQPMQAAPQQTQATPGFLEL